jgi:membrane fusion protein, multidrug efflux system
MFHVSTPKDRLERYRRPLLIAGPVLVVIVIAYFYLTGGRFVSTDDAYLQAARTDISASIDGRVIAVMVKDNQQVHKGDVLFILDGKDSAIAVENAKARLAAAKLDVAALKAAYQIRMAEVQAAVETLDYQKKELQRQSTLAKQGISSRAHFDEVQHAAVNAEQKLAAARHELDYAAAALGGNPDIVIDLHPAVMQAQTALDQVELNLSYTTVRAPQDGIVTKVDLLQPGNYIRKAAPLFALMSDKNIWVEANFKETELTHMQPGQKAEITVDAYSGRTISGRVESLSPGTGSSFALLPPENASGNWVKVVQRLPVRISIIDTDLKSQLRAGLSVYVKVDTHHSRL